MFESGSCLEEHQVSSQIYPEALVKEQTTDTEKSNYALARWYLYLRIAKVVKIGSGAFSKKFGIMDGSTSLLTRQFYHHEEFSSTHDARQTLPQAHHPRQQIFLWCREVVVKKRKAGIGMSLGVIDVKVFGTRNP